MAIQITSLTPTGTNGVVLVTNNTPVLFQCNFTESDLNFQITSVEWQISTNSGLSYNTAPFISNVFSDLGGNLYESDYDTGLLNASSEGNVYRIEITSSSGEILTSDVYLVSNGYPINIGPRTIDIVQNPSIEIISENWQPFYIVPDNGTITVDTSATYLNRSTSLATDLDGLTITWEKSYNYTTDPTNATWTTVNNGTVVNEATYNAVSSTFIYDTVNNFYAKSSTLTISLTKFGINNISFRARYTSTGVNNSPLISSGTFYVLINPAISIARQPGVATSDTRNTAYSYSSGNPSNGVLAGSPGGDFRSSINAVTTAGAFSTLTYAWEYQVYNDGFNNSLNDSITDLVWQSVDEGQTSGRFLVSQKDSTLVLTRLQYYDRYQFRCRVNGTIGEQEVISDTHEIYITDSITNLVNISPTTIVTLEDFYGNIVNRELLTDKPIRNTSFSSAINIANFLGQDGNITLQWQRSEPGSSTFSDIGDPQLILFDDNISRGVGDASNPGASNIILDSSYTTFPLRINDGVGNQRDDNSRYRLKATSSAVYNYNSGVSYPNRKTLVPWYSNIVTLDVYKELFIVTQPSSLDAFPTATVAFSAGIAVTSGLATVTYKWQYTTSVNNAPSSTWTDISNGPFLGVSGENVVTGASGSGVTDTTLVITNVTINIRNYFFRVIISDPGALSSVTSDAVRVRIVEDIFTQISSINDYSVSEFSNVSWDVQASTLSLGTILYQWQKSTNFGQLGNNATWTNLTNTANIQGVTTSVLSISNVQNPEDVGWYRLRLRSQGGTIAFSNVVELSIGIVDITISTNLPNTLTFVEDEFIRTPSPFRVLAFSTNGEDISYQWQYRKVGDPDFVPFGPGFAFQLDDENPYTPLPFSKTDNWDNAQVRVRLSIPSFSSGTFRYSNVSTLDIKRRFFYFADTATKRLSAGSALSLDLNPTYTGTVVPTYAWQYSTNNGSTWSSVAGIGGVSDQPSLFLASIPLSYNNYQFRCLVTLNSVDQFVYTRNNALVIDNFTGGFGYTATVTLNVVSGTILPKFLSQEVGKSGAAVGTVICVPKPAGFVDQNNSAVVDDISFWKVSVSGDPFSTGNVSSVSTSGTNFSQNLTYLNRGSNWINTSTYLFSSGQSPNTLRLPKWLQSDDRFPGFIELRGQWLLKSEFPLLYQILGDTYGSTSTSFKLPNPYGKKVMGTGPVNAQKGRVSVVPLYNADGSSGGDIFLPGTIGGVWNYENYRQLPPGSPGVAGQQDGTAGLTDPSTFSLASYTTTGWTDSNGLATIKLVGSFTYEVGPLDEQSIFGPPIHGHRAVSIGTFVAPAATQCQRASILGPPPDFREAVGDGADILDGPAGISAAEANRTHSHGISNTFVAPGDDKSANQSTGIGDVSAGLLKFIDTVNIDFRPGVTKSLNTFVETSTITMSNASRATFDSNLSFNLRNAETIPINSNYYRVKWMIKAY